VPLASAEGFIRQILGWREYVRGVYWARMPGYDQLNAFGHQRRCRTGSGTARPACAAWRAIGQSSLTHAHSHHIKRLMVIGNFACWPGCRHRRCMSGIWASTSMPSNGWSCPTRWA
jgi:deoxyribodipyrimidine photolyase-related protein